VDRSGRRKPRKLKALQQDDTAAPSI
jgi:hypothetical protein